MLLHKEAEHDSRVRRAAGALADAGHDVTVVELAPARPQPEGQRWRTRSVDVPAWTRRALPFGLYRSLFLVGLVAATVRTRPDVIHVHDAPMLAPGALAALITRARLVYDSHEFATGIAGTSRAWAWLVAALERLVVPRCAAVMTVSGGIADRLQARYHLPTRPTVVRNVTELEPARADGSSGALRSRLGLADGTLVLHQGAAARGRGCETLVRAMEHVDAAHLVFLGTPGNGYAGELERVAAEIGAGERVHFVPSVPLESLLDYTRDADLGVSLLEDTCENHRLALPNKVFEYIAAGVPVVVSDLPELRRLVEGRAIGWTADPASPSSVANAIERGLAARDDSALRQRIEQAADEFTWPRESAKLVALYAGLATS